MSDASALVNDNQRYCSTEIEVNFQTAIDKSKGRHKNVDEVLKKLSNEPLDNEEKKVLQYFANQLYQLIFIDNKRWSQKRNISSDFIVALEHKLGENSKNIILKSKLTSSLSSEQCRINKRDANTSSDNSANLVQNLKSSIINEDQLRSFLSDRMMPDFINQYLKVVDIEKVEEILSRFQSTGPALPGQPNDAFGILLENLRIQPRYIWQSNPVSEKICFVFSTGSMSVFAGTIFIYQADRVEDIVRIGLSLALQIGMPCEENLKILLSYFASKMDIPPSKFFGKKASYSSRFGRF
uniref:Uncharacterized protein n=1 Tax=Strongyloides papillosus TaxID=174720 RepID=A0A0N5BIW5_STREA